MEWRITPSAPIRPTVLLRKRVCDPVVIGIGYLLPFRWCYLGEARPERSSSADDLVRGICRTGRRYRIAIWPADRGALAVNEHSVLGGAWFGRPVFELDCSNSGFWRRTADVCGYFRWCGCFRQGILFRTSRAMRCNCGRSRDGSSNGAAAISNSLPICISLQRLVTIVDGPLPQTYPRCIRLGAEMGRPSPYRVGSL